MNLVVFKPKTQKKGRISHLCHQEQFLLSRLPKKQVMKAAAPPTSLPKSPQRVLNVLGTEERRMSCKRQGYLCLQTEKENHTALIVSRHSAQEQEPLYRERLSCVQEQSTENLWRKVFRKPHICSKCYLQNNSFHECLHGINASLTVLSYSSLASSADHTCTASRPALLSLAP